MLTGSAKTMRWLALLGTSMMAAACADRSMPTEGHPLSLAVNGHYLDKDHRPFFWLGDTGWLAAYKLTPAEMDVYLADRKAKGFNVIQGPIVAVRCSTCRFPMTSYTQLHPDVDGDRPLDGVSPVALNAPFWHNVDHFVSQATAEGLFVAFPIVWGPDIDGFLSNPTEAYDYARAVASRYRAYANIIWIVSGEYRKIAWNTTPRDDRTMSRANLDMINALAHGIVAGKHPQALVTIHPDGYDSSSLHFENASWLDFHMLQSYDSIRQAIDDTTHDFRLRPAKPTLQAELNYENGSSGTPWQVRIGAYTSVFSGSAGFTYGNNDVWHFTASWQDHLNDPATLQMAHLKRLMDTYHNDSRVPDQSLLVSGPVDERNDDYTAVMRDGASAWILVYSTRGADFHLDTRGMRGAIRARWLNPRDGRYASIGTLSPSADQAFDPPGAPAVGNDWVLVLDRRPGAG